MMNGEKGEFYLRYQGYSKPEEFCREVCRLQPLRIDLGPVYENDARLNRDSHTKSNPVFRELTFDIDMDHYDSIRTCCQGKSVCKRCWTFLVAGQEILSTLLSDCFGFKHTLWVFSGRRGIHAWVCDQNAFEMSSEVRRSAAEFLNFTHNNLLTDFLVKPSLIQKIDYKPLQYSNKNCLSPSQ